MASWNQIQTGFDADEETINFGARAISENNGSLYEACVVATIQSHEKVDEKPNVLASLQHSMLCVAIDKSITIFKDDTCHEILCNISFPSLIRCYCISKDGFFLFVILKTGILYCLHLSNGEIICTKTVPNNQNNIMNMFLKEQNEEIFIFLVTNSGAIYRFSNFYAKALQTTYINGDKNMITKHTENIQCSLLYEGFTSVEFLTAAVDISLETPLIAMVGTNSMFIWPNKQQQNFNNVFSFGYKKIKLLKGSRKMLCLRTDHVLSIVCSDTLLALKICYGPVLDFTVIQHDDVNHCEILFLTQSMNNDTIYKLRLISCPDFEQRLEINVSSTTYLLDVYDIPNNIFYIEGIINEQNDVISTFRIKTISESTPELRLERLLRRKQFDAAESFAEKMGLCTESIYCSKAALFIEQLSPWAKSVPASVSIDALINILDKIQNVHFVTECCSKALISDYVQMRQLYLYARQRIVHNMKNEHADKQLNVNLSLINGNLHRLETLQMIQDTVTDTLSDDITMNEWIRFSQANLLEEFNTYLRMGHLKSAALIWTRHLPDIINEVSVQTVQNIFAILPEDISPLCLWPWLNHFVPTLLSLLPEAMDEIVSWGLKKLKYLEISNRIMWPEIGTDFAKQLVKLLKVENNQQFLHFPQEHKYKNSMLKQFMLLFQALLDIEQLKIVHRLRVPLDIYLDAPTEAIYILLDKIHLDEIPDFINTFLKRYMLNNNLQNDVVLCMYIQRTIKNSNSWLFGEEAAWERKISIITGLIYNIENRLEQVWEILRRAPVPWSPTMVTLAETNINTDHSLSFKIKIECDFVPIKLVMKKYGCSTVNNKLISRIIKEDRDSIINDINVLTKKDRQLKQDAFCHCVNVRLNEGNMQKAMDIICYLENDITDVLYCYEGVINYAVALFSLQNVTSLTYHIEFFGCLEFKLHDLLTQLRICSFRYNEILNTIKDLKSLYKLKKNYKIDVSLQHYRTQKSAILEDYITKLFADIKKSDLALIHKTIFKVAELLGLKKSYAILSLLKRTENISILKQFNIDEDKDLNIASDEFKNINETCLLALQYAAADMNTVQIIKNINSSVLNTCQPSDIQAALLFHACISVCPSLSIEHCSDVQQPTRSQSNFKLYTMYKDQAISLDHRLLSLFKHAVSLCLYYSDSDDSNKILHNETHMDELLNKFLVNTKKLEFQHNDYSLLQIFKTFYFTYCNASTYSEIILMQMKSILSQLLINLLKKLCTARSFDLKLGLSCLFMLPEQEAQEWISTTCSLFQSDHFRHSIISILGYDYAYLTKNRSLIQTFEGHKLLHIWAQRLSDYSITYKEVLINDASSKMEILQQIIKCNKENVIFVLKDYCYNFGFNFNDCLLLYLQTLLKTWNPTITFSNTTASKELLICKNDVDELRKKCNAIVAQMEDKSMLKRCISTLWEHITFYHYEVFIILMDLIEDTNMEKRNYLCFLQNYTRSGSPTSIEYEKWIQLNPGCSTLPSIAQWRLPFLLKVEIWKLITPELNLRTYEKWLDIAPVLNLETHLICTLAIKGEVTHVWGNNITKSKNTSWSLLPKNATLLKNIKKCIQRITDSDGFYYGTAALYYVVNHTPSGADCVAAAKECYEYALTAAQNSTKFEEGMLEKIKSKYLRFTSEHILRTHGLEKDKYLILIENPSKLVYELYRDESILLRYRMETNYRPDINAAVNELGKLFSLNLLKLRLELLQEWLQSNSRYTELSQSFTETFVTLKESDQSTNYEDNLLRACYMLEYGDTDLFSQFLINIGFADRHSETEYTCEIRYRALRVLQTIVDTATLEELTKRDMHTFRKYVKSLQYVGKLEPLGLCYSIDTFETCCKRELVQILWKNQRHLPYTLSIITQICIEFEIYDILLWDNTLNQMTKLRMVNELKRVLLQIRRQSAIVNCNGYKMGWQLIISEPFREMDINPSLEQINKCIEAICILFSCPIAHELNFTAIVRNSFECKQALLAAAFLPFLNECDKTFVLQTIKEQYQITELITDLNNLASKGVLTVTRSIAIIQNML